MASLLQHTVQMSQTFLFVYNVQGCQQFIVGGGVRVRVRKIKGPTKPLMASLDSTLECKTGCFIPP